MRAREGADGGEVDRRGDKTEKKQRRWIKNRQSI